MPKNAPESIMTLFEQICDPSLPLPIPRLIGPVENWEKFATFMGNRIKTALFAVITHPTDAKMSNLHVGGDLGLFPVLRMLEFLRRCVKTQSLSTQLAGVGDISVLVRHAEVELSREMWRRWSCGSFVRVRHTEGGKLCSLWHVFMEAYLLSSPHGEEQVDPQVSHG